MSAECSNCKSVCSFKEKCKENEVFGCRCDCCKRILCKNCSRLTTTEVRAVVLSSSRVILYFCETCREAVKLLPVFKDSIPEIRSQIDILKKEHLPRADFDVLKKEISKLKEDLKQFMGKSGPGASYAEVVSKLNRETEDIRSNLKDMSDKIHNVASVNGVTVPDFDPCSEMNERSVRAKNIIIFNMVESRSSNFKERIDHDKAHVISVLEKLAMDVNTSFKVFRIGKPGSGGGRPLKVVFNEQSMALQCLKRRKRLEGSNMAIKSDLTALQRNNLKKLHEELNRRKNSGELDLVISYRNAIPQIIKSKQRVLQPSSSENVDSPNSKND